VLFVREQLIHRPQGLVDGNIGSAVAPEFVFAIFR
jgi:hypothetical protein